MFTKEIFRKVSRAEMLILKLDRLEFYRISFRELQYKDQSKGHVYWIRFLVIFHNHYNFLER